MGAKCAFTLFLLCKAIDRISLFSCSGGQRTIQSILILVLLVHRAEIHASTVQHAALAGDRNYLRSGRVFRRTSAGLGRNSFAEPRTAQTDQPFSPRRKIS